MSERVQGDAFETSVGSRASCVLRERAVPCGLSTLAPRNHLERRTGGSEVVGLVPKDEGEERFRILLLAPMSEC